MLPEVSIRAQCDRAPTHQGMRSVSAESLIDCIPSQDPRTVFGSKLRTFQIPPLLRFPIQLKRHFTKGRKRQDHQPDLIIHHVRHSSRAAHQPKKFAVAAKVIRRYPCLFDFVVPQKEQSEDKPQEEINCTSVCLAHQCQCINPSQFDIPYLEFYEQFPRFPSCFLMRTGTVSAPC